MKALFRTLLHAAIGGACVAVAQAIADPHAAITAGHVILPALASALTSAVSAVTPSTLEDGK